MPVVDAEALKDLEHLLLVSRRLGGGLLCTPRARLPAGGTQLSGHRDYAPGDDYRRVDWSLCARHDELLVRQFQGEADCPVYILLDCSGSMALGRPRKFDVARKVAVALAYVALSRLDPVSVLAFSDRILADSGPMRGKARILKLAGFLEGLAPRPEPTDLRLVAEQLVVRGQRRGLAVWVSDWCDPKGFARGLDTLRRSSYQPRVIQLCDPREAEPEAIGDLELVDPETGTSQEVRLTERHLARYRRLYAEFLDSLRSYCFRYRLGCVQVPIDLTHKELLFSAIGARSKPSCSTAAGAA